MPAQTQTLPEHSPPVGGVQNHVGLDSVLA